MLDRADLHIGITFEEFRRFYQFLNNLDDFSIAMRMYTLADHPISKGKKLKYNDYKILEIFITNTLDILIYIKLNTN